MSEDSSVTVERGVTGGTVEVPYRQLRTESRAADRIIVRRGSVEYDSLFALGTKYRISRPGLCWHTE